MFIYNEKRGVDDIQKASYKDGILPGWFPSVHLNNQQKSEKLQMILPSREQTNVWPALYKGDILYLKLPPTAVYIERIPSPTVSTAIS